MKSHEQYAALLDAFIDGALTETEAEEVRAHLAQCPDCQAYVSDALAMRDLFPGIEETIVPEGFAESVFAALPAQKHLSLWRQPWMRAALPLAACVTIVLLLYGVSGLPAFTPSGGASYSMDTGGGMMKHALSVAADADDESDLDLDGVTPEESAPEVTAETEGGAYSAKESTLDAGDDRTTGSASNAGSDMTTGSASNAGSDRTTESGGNATAGSGSNGNVNMTSGSVSGADSGVTTGSVYSAGSQTTADTGGQVSEYRYAEAQEAEESTETVAETTSAPPSIQSQSADTPLLGASSSADGDTMPPNSTEDMNALPPAALSAPAPEPSEGAAAKVVPQTESVEIESEIPQTQGTEDELPQTDNPAWTDTDSLALTETVSVWILSPDAATVMERYPYAKETASGIWYTLTQTEFDELCAKFPEVEIVEGPETMSARDLPADAPPPDFSEAVYLFLPLSTAS